MSETRLGNPMDYAPSVAPKSDRSHCAQHVEVRTQTEDKTEDSAPPLQGTQSQINYRDGDTRLGIPQVEIKGSRVLSAQETQAYQQANEEQIRQQAEEMLVALESENEWHLPKSLKRMISVILLVGASILGVMIITEAVQFSASVQALSQWSKWLAVTGFSLFGGIIACMIVWLLWHLIRLQRSPSINLKVMQILSERQKMQQLAHKKQAEAKKRLVVYLRDYPMTPQMRKKLIALGMTTEQWSRLESGQRRLLDSTRPMTPSDWCDDFQRCFQETLDELVLKRINQYALRVGISTATSPIAMLDRMIVLYSSLAMIKDLLTIYQLRPANGQTLVIFAKAIMHTYLSGFLGEATESVAKGVSETLAEMSDDGLGLLTGTIAPSIGAKIMEAALNRIFIRRLGKKTIQLIQPVLSHR